MPLNAKPLLIVDDDTGLLRQLRWAFSDHKVYPAGTRQEAIDLVRNEAVPVAIVDLGLPPDPDGASEGLATLTEVLAIAPATKVIIATGNETREHALRAIALGAYDFYQKPIDIDVLQLIVSRAEHMFELEAENRRLIEAAPTSPVDGIIAGSPEMLQVLRTIEKIAPTDVAVLLLGESGTGKELLAHGVHRMSGRARAPFVPINCAAIPETLLESELFGHEKGAFTGAIKQNIGRIESADRGTLFLDEIGDVPMPMQVKLLRFLQDQIVERIGGRKPVQVDVRIVCATNQDIERMMAEGRFREDLYYRLNEVTVRVPPLRERVGDAVVLASFFLRRFTTEYGRPVRGFSSAALAAIKDHSWPGNVRELENRVKRAVVMADGALLSATDLGLSTPGEEPQSLGIRAARARAEREVLQLALAQAGSNLSKAAKLLGISRPTLYDLMQQHQIGLDAKGKAMPQGQRRYLWRCVSFAAAVSILACHGAYAKDSTASIKEAEQYVAKGNLKAAEIELRNAIRESPQDPVLRVRLAEIYLQLGDAAAAEREARAARERNGNEADYIPVLADALLRQDKFADVLDLIQPGDRNPVLESKIRTALGTAAAGMRDRDKAETLLREAIKLDPTAARPKIQLARMLSATKPEEADKFIDEVIAANPHSSEALQVKGEMLRARGDLNGAMRLFDDAVKIDPKNVLARLSRANVNIAQSKFDAADEDLNPILKAAPNNFMANYLRGLELARQGQELHQQQKFADADRIFDRISPGFAVFWAGYYLQGATKLALGQYAQAETVLGKYLNHVPDDMRAARLIATAALQQRAAGRAIGYLKPLVDKLPADAATMTLLGNAYMVDGKPDLALRQFEKAAKLDPDNPAIKTRVGISEINAGQGQQGLATLEEVFATEAGAAVAGPTLVLTELRAKRLDKAAEVAASLINREPKNAVYHTLLGVVRVAQRNYPEAESAFRAALALDPELPSATRDLAQLYAATKRIDEAKKVYNDLLGKKADDVSALLGLADIYIAEKKWSEATDAINRARSAARNDPAPGLKLISLYELRQDWNSAKTVAAELATQFPRDSIVLDAQGRAQLAAGDLNGAIASYKRAYELVPSSLQILSRYLALLNSAKYFDEARGVLQDAIGRDPHNANLKADLIRVEGEINGVDAAVAKARALAKDDPGADIYDLVSAELYEKAGRSADAIATLEKAAAAKPSDDGLTIALSRIYIRTGDFGKAEATLTRRLKADPKDIAVNAALAPLYVTTGRLGEAQKVYGGLLSQRPNDVAALLGLADIGVAEKKWPEAKDYIARARAAAPNDPTPAIALVNFYGLKHDWKEAAATAGELVESFPANPDVLDAQGRVQIASGDTDAAIATYKRLYQLSPTSIPILSRYLGLLNDAKKFAEARAVLQTALDRNPKYGPLKGDLIRVEAEIGGLEAGLQKARAFAKDDPENPIYDIVSAGLYEKANRVGEGVALLEKAVARKPTDDGLITALSRLYVRAGDPAKAESVLNNRLQIDPKDAEIRWVLASFYLDQKKYDSAIAEYTRVISERPADASALNNLAWLYQQKHDLAKARSLAERAIAAAPRAPQIDDTLGWILLAQGEADRAVSYLSFASLSAPRNPDIQYHLAVALNRVGRAADAQAMLETLLGSGVAFSDKAEAEKLLQELKRG